jgi:tRNA(Arg) A34 adenosine deaminase TadA
MCCGAIHWSGIKKVVFALSQDNVRIMTSPTENQTPLDLLRSKEIFARSTKKIEALARNYWSSN